MNEQSTQERAIKDYFRITEAPGAQADGGLHESSIAGLRRLLGPWLDVRDKTVLDLGSGRGETCSVCLAAGATSATGVNLSQGEIDVARAHTGGTFVLQDVEEFLRDCAPESYDRIFALNFLEHLDRDKLLRICENAWRVLRPNGTLVAMVPNATSPFGCMTRYWDITHYNAFTPNSLRQLSRLCGFGDAIEYRECGPVAHGIVSGVRCALWQMVRLTIKARLLIELASTKGGIYTADMLVRFTKSS